MKHPEYEMRIAIADDHPVIHHALRVAIAHVPDLCVAASAASGAELLDALRANPHQLVITDLAMHGTQSDHDGLHLIAQLKRLYPAVPVIVFTMLTNRDVLLELDRMNVAGIVSKADNLVAFIQALRDVALQGTPYRSPTVRAILAQPAVEQPGASASLLSAKEIEVLRLYGLGLSLTEIAARFNRSVSTVATQKAHAMRKLGIRTHAEVIRYARVNRLV